MSKPVHCETIFSGRIITVGLEEHRLPNDRQASFEMVRHPGGAAVLPILADGRVLLIKQYRAAVGRMIYEIPAGRLESDEAAESCAARELVEEVGYRAGRLEPLGGLWSSVGFCDEYISLFLGHDLAAVGQELEADEVIELCPVSMNEAMSMLGNGEILDAKTQLALLRYQQVLDGESR
jgi:ADP-ribose pyrophosphatase